MVSYLPSRAGEHLTIKNLKNDQMKTTVKLLPVFLSTVLFTGCMSYLSIDKQLPPEIQLNQDVYSISLVNLYDYEMVDFHNPNKISVFQSGVNGFLDQLEKSFEYDARFDLRNTNELVKGRWQDHLPERPLSKDSIKLFCKEYNTELLLALEAYNIYFDKDVEVEENEDGSKTRTAYYDLVVYTGLSLYDSTGAIIDRSNLRRSDFYKSREVLSGLLAIGPALGRAGSEINTLSLDLGKEYIKKFNPSFITEQKKYYTGQDMEEVTPLMISGNYEGAAEKLLPMVNGSKYSVRRKAAYNLSVAYELMGDNDSSKKWLKVSKMPQLKNPDYKVEYEK